jgi:hypothetical protein
MKISTQIFLISTLFFLLSSAFADSLDSGWEYLVSEGKVKSSRLYMLVLNAGEPKEKRLEVRSVCERPKDTEATFGECVHTIHMSPDSKKLELKTGETVFLPYFGGTLDNFPLVIGTIQYGCCGGTNTIDFYGPDGTRMGSLPTFINDHSGVPDRITDFNNAANHNLILTTENDQEEINNKSNLILWKYLESEKYSKELVKLNLPETPACIWTIAGAFFDKDVLDINFSLVQCDVPKEVVKARCKKSEAQWSCTEAKH